MTPMTRPARRYWERRWKSIDRALRARPGSARLPLPDRPRGRLAGNDQLARLELGRVDDLGLGEGHIGLGVLHHQDRGRPLLPVRPLAAAEADRRVPALELIGEQGLHQGLACVALRRL